MRDSYILSADMLCPDAGAAAQCTLPRYLLLIAVTLLHFVYFFQYGGLCKTVFSPENKIIILTM